MILLVNEFEYSESVKYTYTPQEIDSEWEEEPEYLTTSASFETPLKFALPAENNTEIFDNESARMIIGCTRYTKTLLYFMGYYYGFGELHLSVQYVDGSIDEFSYTMTNFSALRAIYIPTVNKTICGVKYEFIPKEYNEMITGEENCVIKLSRNTIKAKASGCLELYNDTGTVVGNLEVKKDEQYVIDATTTGYALYILD